MRLLALLLLLPVCTVDALDSWIITRSTCDGFGYIYRTITDSSRCEELAEARGFEYGGATNTLDAAYGCVQETAPSQRWIFNALTWHMNDPAYRTECSSDRNCLCEIVPPSEAPTAELTAQPTSASPSHPPTTAAPTTSWTMVSSGLLRSCSSDKTLRRLTLDECAAIVPALGFGGEWHDKAVFEYRFPPDCVWDSAGSSGDFYYNRLYDGSSRAKLCDDATPCICGYADPTASPTASDAPTVPPTERPTSSSPSRFPTTVKPTMPPTLSPSAPSSLPTASPILTTHLPSEPPTPRPTSPPTPRPTSLSLTPTVATATPSTSTAAPTSTVATVATSTPTTTTAAPTSTIVAPIVPSNAPTRALALTESGVETDEGSTDGGGSGGADGGGFLQQEVVAGFPLWMVIAAAGGLAVLLCCCGLACCFHRRHKHSFSGSDHARAGHFHAVEMPSTAGGGKNTPLTASQRVLLGSKPALPPVRAKDRLIGAGDVDSAKPYPESLRVTEAPPHHRPLPARPTSEPAKRQRTLVGHKRTVYMPVVRTQFSEHQIMVDDDGNEVPHRPPRCQGGGGGSSRRFEAIQARRSEP